MYLEYCSKNCKGYQETGRCISDRNCKSCQDYIDEKNKQYERENSLGMLVHLTKHRDMVADLINVYGENITLKDLFSKIIEEKKEYWNNFLNT